MKTTKCIALALIAIINLTACSSDDDATPEVINEEEVITTITVTLVPQTGETVTLSSRDLDGDGPNPPVINISGSLQAGILYEGSIELLNETVSPAEIVNEEIEEEADAHQFFYQVSTGLNATITYTDTENEYLSNGSQNPVGINFQLQAGDASTGILSVTLRHQPSKDAAGVSDGDIANAGGESDVAQSFEVEIE
ncbi:type 1 periplasmic binding fold superfamily protein [Leeuwenhoekiella marinoflava]|uniref:type 1 periplasmic binding fold superfamily protein n=1 Tax=Leeuwenhoekiella marinoflava TaxID=988 RepID=UPI0030026EFA